MRSTEVKLLSVLFFDIQAFIYQDRRLHRRRTYSSITTLWLRTACVTKEMNGHYIAGSVFADDHDELFPHFQLYMLYNTWTLITIHNICLTQTQDPHEPTKLASQAQEICLNQLQRCRIENDQTKTNITGAKQQNCPKRNWFQENNILGLISRLIAAWLNSKKQACNFKPTVVPDTVIIVVHCKLKSNSPAN